jgi:hypothetical protein
MTTQTAIHTALQNFAASVATKMTQLTSGEPEDQLRGPFENFMADVADALGWKVVCTGETPLPDRLGRPDYAIHLNKLLAGYVELKAPGVGVVPARFKGHNRNQFKRFSAIPNILYADGNDWALYREGKLVGEVVRLSGDIATHGKRAVAPDDVSAIENLLRDFFLWQPHIPADRKGRIDLKGLAALLAPLCRMLRDDVTDALKNSNSPLVQLAKDWRQLLFPDASDEQFADSYAQTVAFALLLGRSEGANPLTLESAESALKAQHNLLSRALQVLTDPGARREMTASVDLLLRVIGIVPLATLAGPEDPWLYFYEDFLTVYDPELRKDAGAYYTPVQVVRCQVRLIDDLLVHLLGKPLGFADPGVITLDPAAGTGTYLLGVIDHALRRIESEQGSGAVAGQATALATNLYGFELMVGPYAVAELRISRALRDKGAQLQGDGTHVYLTDTLESPNAEPPQMPLFLRPIAEQHAKALRVKSKVPVIVCLGNPPYDRHEAATVDNKARTGGWVRWGDKGTGDQAILRDFLDPVKAAGHGGDLKNLYNLYVYFWRWALWKVFEQETLRGPGIVSFISASSYIDGDAFCGMREHMRRQCDSIWILDLGGEGRGTRQDENVFAIQTPVAIAVAVRSMKAKKNKAAKVHYARIEGTREAKFDALDAIQDFSDVEWQDCPEDWRAAFRPAGEGKYFDWPLLTHLMPWQNSGITAGRTWVISPDKETLHRRWRELMRVTGEERRRLFKDSPTGCKLNNPAIQLPPVRIKLQPLSQLSPKSPPPETAPCSFRSFDRQYIFADGRLIDRPGPGLWEANSERQLYLTTLLNHPLGDGPALTACAYIPDKHHFRGSFGAKEILPLYRSSNPDPEEPNILPGLLELLGKQLQHQVSSEDFLAYVYGALAQPSFTSRFAKELETRELRVPITKDAALFEQLRAVGAHLLWLHTYGERFRPKGKQRGSIPRGKTKCTKAVPGDADGYPESFEYNATTKTLNVGDGRFAPVSQEVYEFEVSGLKVVQSWLKYRMKNGAGKNSSPLNHIHPSCWTGQFTTELLELLWVLEATVEGYPEQARLLEEVINSDLFHSVEFPFVPEDMRHPSKAQETEESELNFEESS